MRTRIDFENGRLKRGGVLLLGLAGWMLPQPPAATAAMTNVSIGDNFFFPTNVAINVNDSVKWTWTGFISHSTTSTTGLWNSGVTSANGHTFTNTFASAGTFPYLCSVHTNTMRAAVVVQTAVNTPPSVTITNPANGAVFNAPASFSLGAAASDPGGSVTNVQFFQGATSLGNDTTAPYAVALNNVGAGNYTFSAVASDNLGAKATNTISVIVNALPTVAITNPTNGAILSAPASLTLNATASDADGNVTNVQFLRGTTTLGNDTTSPYSMPVASLAAGSYIFSAIASDNRGARATNTISITAVTPVPIVIGNELALPPTGFRFSYTANPGLSYQVLRSSDLSNWTPLSTNVAASNSVTWIDGSAPVGRSFYRVMLQPNP